MHVSSRLAFVAVAVLVLSVGAAGAQERVAQLTKVSGSVEIERATSGAVDVARQLGPRIRNGSVYANDVVNTGPSASAKIVFSDGSEVELQEKTSLSIREGTTPTAGAAGSDTAGRIIKVLAGKVLADIVPDGKIATEFETPSGIAAVKGTRLVIEVDEPIS